VCSLDIRGDGDRCRAKGCEIQIGIDMLFEQIPAYLEFFGFPSTTPSELREVAEIDY
jgi:shikimate dehydrogenase